MIIVINGPLGVGKTETSWQLMQRFTRAVMLDGDCLAAIHPFAHYNPSHLDYAYEVFGLLVSFHRQKGIHDFVINWVFESPASLQRLQAEVRPPGGTSEHLSAGLYSTGAGGPSSPAQPPRVPVETAACRGAARDS